MPLETDDIALTDGRWVIDPRTRVMRWKPNPEEPPAPEPTDLHRYIACPTCHARIDETCKTVSGHSTSPHGSRLAGRLCRCGNDLPRQRRMCDTCRDDRNRINKLESQRRLRRRQERDEEAA